MAEAPKPAVELRMESRKFNGFNYIFSFNSLKCLLTIAEKCRAHYELAPSNVVIWTNNPGPFTQSSFIYSGKNYGYATLDEYYLVLSAALQTTFNYPNATVDVQSFLASFRIDSTVVSVQGFDYLTTTLPHPNLKLGISHRDQ
jgi:hypothetical protein